MPTKQDGLYYTISGSVKNDCTKISVTICKASAFCSNRQQSTLYCTVSDIFQQIAGIVFFFSSPNSNLTQRSDGSAWWWLKICKWNRRQFVTSGAKLLFSFSINFICQISRLVVLYISSLHVVAGEAKMKSNH
ncbi:hypothetical protein T4B_12101 [Trichinella pseudospiralis]|uniref:Uncharacterized protein n=1 Tax=Trichinella pseudospiralis TaxID=6337 RepID=A0A0V1ISL6_TRIPS|nr:hypothetical protein T4B_12101 [Trichinella pseudospiralis]